MGSVADTDEPSQMNYFSSGLQNVLTKIIGAREGDTVIEALYSARIMDVADLFDLDINEDTFTLPPEGKSKTPVRLLNVTVRKLQNISRYAQYILETEGRLLKDDEWAALTKEEYTGVMMSLRQQSNNPSSSTASTVFSAV